MSRKPTLVTSTPPAKEIDQVTTFSIDPRAVYAMHVLGADADIRYYLNGVLFEVHDKHIILVATDGHVMGARKCASSDISGPNVEFNMPNEMVKKLKPGRYDFHYTFSFNNVTKEITVKGAGETFSQQAVEGKFPDWRRVSSFKTDPSQGPAQFNPEYPARFAKFSRLVRNVATKANSFVMIHHNGPNSAARIGVQGLDYDEFIGVMMPVRGESSAPGVTLWPGIVYPDPILAAEDNVAKAA